MLATVVSLLIVLAGCENPVKVLKAPEPVAAPEPAEFVERQICVECHEEQYKEWAGSHHDLAMDVASEATVVGDFNNTTFTHQGVTSRFYRRNNEYYIRTDGPDGKMQDFKVSYVFGVDPLQQYMIEFPDGRVQLPDIAWDDHPKEEGGQRWVHLHPDYEITPKHIFHWTRRFLNWNYMCAECHSTNLQKNYDMETNTFKTTWSEIDVGCQACHGPGSNHVKWARLLDTEDNNQYAYEELGLEVNLKADNSYVQIESCARCHSRRNGLRKDYTYGKPFMDYYVPQVLTDPFYYPDGQILDEVYVYGSFLQSKKYQHGVRCTDCHNPHTARLRTYGNELCTGCHSSTPPQEFSGIKGKDYDSPAHHFHKEDSPGAQCVECHMPETKYMVVDPRRDHSFQIPRPDLSEKIGIPNSCNRCHKDKSAAWAADIIDEVHSLTKEQRQEKHFAESFHAGQAGDPESESELIRVAGDSSRPAIIRATALNILSGFRSDKARDITIQSLYSEEPLIRYEAVRGISVLIPKAADIGDLEKKYSFLVTLLRDPVFAVRSEAARALTEVPSELFDKLHLSDFYNALEEYKQRQESIADRPESHLNLGLMYENIGEGDKAEASYKTAMQLVYDFTPAMFNLANFYNRTGRNIEAKEMFQKIIEFEPENGEAYYSLGLLMAEMKMLQESVDAFAKAVELIPGRARLRFNYSLALRYIGRSEDSLSEMQKAHELDRSDPGIVQTLAIFHIQEKQWAKALPYAEHLVQLVPGAPGPEQMLSRIKDELSKKSTE